MSEIWMLYSTFPRREEALSVVQALVKERLVACANIYGDVLSVYRWEGQVQQEPEVVMLAKTRRDKVAPALERIKALHPYQLPCIVSWPLAGGHPPFMHWVAEETA